MKITQNLPQFEHESLLILVTGKQDAIMYHASNGTINHIDDIKIPRLHYSDYEGEFKTRSAGGTIRSGGAVEYNDKNVIHDFIKELKLHIRKISTKDKEFSHIYIITPPQVKNTVMGALPTTMRKKVKGVIEGNYYRDEPRKIIEKIAAFEESSKPSASINAEAEKILIEADQARHVVGGKQSTNTKTRYSSKTRF